AVAAHPAEPHVRAPGPHAHAETEPISPQQASLPSFTAALHPSPPDEPTRPTIQPPLKMGFGAQPRSREEGPSKSQSASPGATAPAQARLSPPAVESSSTARTGAVQPVPLLSVPLRLVGVIGRLYVVFESDRGLVLLDQHAAHERVLFEQMLNRLETSEQAPSQRLLL